MPDPELVPEVVERVARALYEDAARSWNLPDGWSREWDGLKEQGWRSDTHPGRWLAQAGAALAALRPMTKAMSRAAVRGRDGHHVIGDPDVVWSCIMDAMLQPEPELLHVSEEESRRLARLVLRDKVDPDAP